MCARQMIAKLRYLYWFHHVGRFDDFSPRRDVGYAFSHITSLGISA
jgi:hypothetical protein